MSCLPPSPITADLILYLPWYPRTGPHPPPQIMHSNIVIILHTSMYLSHV